MASRNQIMLLCLFAISVAAVVYNSAGVILPTDTEPTRIELSDLKVDEDEDEDEMTSAAVEKVAIAMFRVTSPMLTVRSKPDRQSDKVRLLKEGDLVKKLGQTGRWVKIGKNQYVSSTYLEPVEGLSHH